MESSFHPNFPPAREKCQTFGTCTVLSKRFTGSDKDLVFLVGNTFDAVQAPGYLFADRLETEINDIQESTAHNLICGVQCLLSSKAFRRDISLAVTCAEPVNKIVFGNVVAESLRVDGAANLLFPAFAFFHIRPTLGQCLSQ